MPKEETLKEIAKVETEMKQALKTAGEKLRELEALKNQAAVESAAEIQHSGELH